MQQVRRIRLTISYDGEKISDMTLAEIGTIRFKKSDILTTIRSTLGTYQQMNRIAIQYREMFYPVELRIYNISTYILSISCNRNRIRWKVVIIESKFQQIG